jgi:hypothetical protein
MSQKTLTFFVYVADLRGESSSNAVEQMRLPGIATLIAKPRRNVDKQIEEVVLQIDLFEPNLVIGSVLLRDKCADGRFTPLSRLCYARFCDCA